jgi:hypothetical protein
MSLVVSQKLNVSIHNSGLQIPPPGGEAVSYLAARRGGNQLGWYFLNIQRYSEIT